MRQESELIFNATPSFLFGNAGAAKTLEPVNLYWQQVLDSPGPAIAFLIIAAVVIPFCVWLTREA